MDSNPGMSPCVSFSSETYVNSYKKINTNWILIYWTPPKIKFKFDLHIEKKKQTQLWIYNTTIIHMLNLSFLYLNLWVWL